MKFTRLLVTAALAVFISDAPGFAQDGHQHKHELSEKLGQVNFATSCSKPAQQKFNRAAALLHSFWYDEAEKGFTDVAKTDPKCGMAHWGVAMSWYHPVWQPPTKTELQNGIAAVEKAKLVGARTQREKDYIAAIAIFYQGADKLDHRTRALAYEKAMEQLHLRYPKDREAGIFYSLALLGTALPTDKTYAKQKKAAEILNRVLAAEPNHPGVAHYIIHSFDYPALWHWQSRAAIRRSRLTRRTRCTCRRTFSFGSGCGRNRSNRIWLRRQRAENMRPRKTKSTRSITSLTLICRRRRMARRRN